MRLAAHDDELLAKVLGDQGCPGRDEGQDDVEQKAKEGDHGSERYHDGLFLAGSRSGAAMTTSPSERPDQIPLTYGVFAPHSEQIVEGPAVRAPTARRAARTSDENHHRGHPSR
jgi:hypothetical protein